MKKGVTAREKLIEVTKQRKWYGNLYKDATARRYKQLLLQNKLSTDKIKQILTDLGYSPIVEEKW